MYKLLAIFIFITNAVLSQYNVYEFSNGSHFVSTSSSSLVNSWAGGINNAQMAKLDVNFDNKEDFIVYDKSADRVMVFVQKNNEWVYEPVYTQYLPKIYNFIYIGDYNCDGKKDIFTNVPDNSQIRVYKNTSTSTQLSWSITYNELKATGVAGILYPITPGIYDMPAITDVDMDGDLDILLYDTNAGSGVVFNKNLSKETYGTCDTLIFEKHISCWGNFSITHDCNTLIGFGTGCPNYGGIHDARIMHDGVGISAADMDGNGTTDLFVSHVECNKISLLMNTGNNALGNITSKTDNYPTAIPVDMRKFPIAYYTDANFDNIPDLITSTNLPPDEQIYTQDYDETVWLYTNSGTTTNPGFNTLNKKFLQETMIDIGQHTAPALADYDHDGDYDLFVGSKGKTTGSFYIASLYLYENIGTKDTARYILKTDNYLALNTLGGSYLFPGFADINYDGALDLYFTISIPAQGSSIKYIINKNDSTRAFDLSNAVSTLPVSIYGGDKVTIFDINKDTKPDVFVASGTIGNLIYYKNTSSNPTTPSFTEETSTYLDYTYDFARKGFSVHFANLTSPDSIHMIIFQNKNPIKIRTSAYLSSPNFGAEDSLIIYNKLNTYNQTSKTGYYNTFASADLNGDGFKEILIGTESGGLMLLNNMRKKVTIIKPKPDTLPLYTNNGHNIGKNIYPNPTYDGVINIKIIPNTQLTVFDIYGKEVCYTTIFENEFLKTIKITDTKGIFFIFQKNKSHFLASKVVYN
ncbi:MAG: hypothetical protein NW207_02905 [Cytophagales bacterium]|nr:hypothetical protein [Cytophagales bacterium]